MIFRGSLLEFIKVFLPSLLRRFRANARIFGKKPTRRRVRNINDFDQENQGPPATGAVVKSKGRAVRQHNKSTQRLALTGTTVEAKSLICAKDTAPVSHGRIIPD